MSAHEFDNIYFGDAKGPSHDGKLRFASQGVGWKSRTDELYTIKAEEITKATWLRSCRSYQLRLVLSAGDIVKFDNFARDAYDEVKDLLRSLYHISIALQELSVKGWNWGKTEIQQQCMAFKVSNRTMFEIPYTHVSSACAGKNEVTIELCNPTQTPIGRSLSDRVGSSREDQLVECRFFVPGMADIDEQHNHDTDGEDQTAQTAAEHLCSVLKSRSEFDAERGNHIGCFKELPFLTPRGRYDVDMFSEFMRLRGKSYDYKIAYSSIIKLFVLPKPNDIHVHFVMALDPPLRQGQTRYTFLVLQFAREEEISVELNLEDPEIAIKFAGKLAKSYDAQTCTVVPEIFRGLTGRKIQRSGIYRNSLAQNESVVKCSLKANEGFFHILDRAFLFIPKPAIYFEHLDISYITFSRVSGGNSRTFDLAFTLKGGNVVNLSNISREEYAALEIYLKSAKLVLKNELVVETQELYSDGDSDKGNAGKIGDSVDENGGGEEDDDDDEDFVLGSDVESSDDDSADSEDESGSEIEDTSAKKRKPSKEEDHSPSSRSKKARLR